MLENVALIADYSRRVSDGTFKHPLIILDEDLLARRLDPTGVSSADWCGENGAVPSACVEKAVSAARRMTSADVKRICLSKTSVRRKAAISCIRAQGFRRGFQSRFLQR